LLPAAAVAENDARAKLVCARAGSDSRTVYSGYKVREKLEYMHANPVKRGLVKNPSAWIWSSCLFYEKGQAGLVTMDPMS
jgi:hypothetical protein